MRIETITGVIFIIVGLVGIIIYKLDKNGKIEPLPITATSFIILGLLVIFHIIEPNTAMALGFIIMGGCSIRYHKSLGIKSAYESQKILRWFHIKSEISKRDIESRQIMFLICGIFFVVCGLLHIFRIIEFR